MISWFVVHTQPLKEGVAEQHLKAQGFEVYLPKFIKTCRHARKIQEVAAPLFPRYLFVGMDLEIALWRSINGTRGVSYLLTNNGVPANVPQEVISVLKQQEDNKGLITAGSFIPFVKGDTVRVLEGAFEGQTAIFEKLDDEKRVHLLLAFMSREIKIALPMYAVEAA